VQDINLQEVFKMSEIAVVKTAETKEGVVFRIYKDEKFYFVNKEFNNYFHVDTSTYQLHEPEFVSSYLYKNVKEILHSNGKVKIVLNNNFARRSVRDFWDERGKTYEADIMANKRWLLDNPINLHNELIPFTSIDIETDDRLPLEKDERGRVIAKSRILSIAAVDMNDKVFFTILKEDTDIAEREMLTEFLTYMNDYGIFTGWNSEFFDSPYIKQRCDTLGLKYDILEFSNHLDYMDLVKKYYRKSLKSYSLNNVSKVLINDQKLDQEKGEGKIYNTWLNNKEQLRDYNIQDAQLIQDINKKYFFIEVSMRRANNAKCHVRNTMNNSDSGDYLLLRGYHKAGITFLSKPTEKEVEIRKAKGKISGGFTRCLYPGFYPVIKVWDFKSFYPAVIETFNIDPYTYVGSIYNDTHKIEGDYIISPSNFNEESQTYHPRRLYKKEKGVIPTVLHELVETRDKIKYTMKKYKDTDPLKYKAQYLEQYALKVDANSIYGILSFPYSRYYSWDLGDTVTTACQHIIKKCYKKLEDWGCKVIGGDTDSVFVDLGTDHTVEEIDDKFVEYFKELALEWNVKPEEHKIVFEYEKSYEPFIIIKKKNYAFKLDGEIGMKGLEAIKSDSNALAAQLQNDFLTDILNLQYDESKWEALVYQYYEKCFNQELTADDLTLIKAMTKMPKDYEGFIIDKKTGKPKIKKDGTLQKKAIPAHVKLASRLMGLGKDLYPGSKIKYVVVEDAPILAITPEEFNSKNGEFPYTHKKKGNIIYYFSGHYAAKYYWRRIIKPLIKVACVYHCSIPNWNWNLTPSEINKLYTENDEDEE
jgi:DNA polymerase elongation subunit (family B)